MTPSYSYFNLQKPWGRALTGFSGVRYLILDIQLDQKNKAYKKMSTLYFLI